MERTRERRRPIDMERKRKRAMLRRGKRDITCDAKKNRKSKRTDDG